MSDNKQFLVLSTEKVINAVHHLIYLNHLVEMASEELGELANPEMHRERAEILLSLYLQEARSDFEVLNEEFSEL